jgi:hypothetical protein
MDKQELAELLKAMGCPEEKSSEMSNQLLKRAAQLAIEKRQTEQEALTYLLGLMRQGWAAQGRGF